MERSDATRKWAALIAQGALPNDPRFKELEEFVDLQLLAILIGTTIPDWNSWNADAYFEEYQRRSGKK